MLRGPRAGVPSAAVTVTARGWTAAVLGLVATVVSTWAIGLPGTLVLLGAWLLGCAAHRCVPRLDGPVSWAAAVVLELGLLSAASMAVALVSRTQHGAAVNLAVLCFPIVVAAAVLVLRRGRDDGSTRAPSRALVALTLSVAGVLVPVWIAGHGVDYRSAWVMSGDSRNQLLFVRTLLHSGGLTIDTLRGYPAVIDALTALLSGAGGRSGLRPGQLMMHDVHALVTTYVLCGIAIAVTTAAVVLEMLPRAVALTRRLPAGAVLLVLATGLVPVSALVLGTSVQDGFVTAYGTIPVVVAAIALSLRALSGPSPAAFALVGPAGALAFLSWTLLATIPLALVVAVSLALLWQHRSTLRSADRGALLRSMPARGWAVAVVLSWASLLLCTAVTVTHVTLLHHQFLQSGTVTPAQPRLLWLLGFLAVAVGMTAGRSRGHWVVPVVAALAAGATLKFLIWLSSDGRSWAYYAVKAEYLLAGALLWVAFVPGLLALVRPTPEGDRAWVSEAAGVVQAVAYVLVLFVLLQWTTPLTSPLSRAAKGWNQPSAGVVTEVAKVADSGKPFLLWGVTDPGNERLGNFWAVLTWAYKDEVTPLRYPPTVPAGMSSWAYLEQDQPKDICAAARGVHGLEIVTQDRSLARDLAKSCPGTGAHVTVIGTG